MRTPKNFEVLNTAARSQINNKYIFKVPIWRNCVNARLLTSPCPRKLHPRTFEGGANKRFGNVRELKVVHDIVAQSV